MPNFPEHRKFLILRIRVMMRLETAIRPDFSESNLRTIVAVIACLIQDGVDKALDIYRYLTERGCKFDRPTIEFLLQAYEGSDPRHYLWTQNSFGAYTPLIDDYAGDLPRSLCGELDGMSETGI